MSSVKWRPFCLGLNVLTHWLGDNWGHLKCAIFKHIQDIDLFKISCDIVLRWTTHDLTDDQSVLTKAMALCCQTTSQCWKLGQFTMPETCANWLELVNSCIYYACQTRYCHTQWISQLSRSFEIHWVRQYLTHWSPGNLDVILKMPFSILFYWLVSSDLLMIMLSDGCHRTLLTTSQYWFK